MDAAAFVALSVPGGAEQLAGTGHGAEVVAGGVDVELRTQALAGLEQMLRPGNSVGSNATAATPPNDWDDTWIDGDEDGEGARTARAIAAVLRPSLG